MTRSLPTFFSTPAAWISLIGLTVTMTSCGGAFRQASALEDDELYLSRGEEFLTDEEYLSYAFEQAGFSESEELEMDSRAGDGFNSNFGYVPQSLRGRSMLRGYMTPYGAAGFGPNPYDPYGSAFYGGYNPYDPYGSNMGWNNGWSNSWGSPSGWGMNPYMGYGFGSGFGYNPYAYNPYGFNNGWGGGYNVYQGSGWLGGGDLGRIAGCGGAADPDLGFLVHQQRHRRRPLADQQMDGIQATHPASHNPGSSGEQCPTPPKPSKAPGKTTDLQQPPNRQPVRLLVLPRVPGNLVGLLPLHGVQAPGRRDRGLPIRAATGRKPAQAPQAGPPAEAKAPGAAVGQEVVAVHPDAERT